MRTVAIQPFRQTQGLEPVEGLDCFLVPLTRDSSQ